MTCLQTLTFQVSEATCHREVGVVSPISRVGRPDARSHSEPCLLYFTLPEPWKEPKGGLLSLGGRGQVSYPFRGAVWATDSFWSQKTDVI